MLKSYVAFDIETTGLSPEHNEIIEIGALKVREGKVVDRFIRFIEPEAGIPPMITELTGITNEMVEGAGDCGEVLPEFLEFCEQDTLIGHNVQFDFSFVKTKAKELGYTYDHMGIDTLKIARKTLKGLESRGLEYLCNYYGIADENHHRAFNDAEVTSKLYNVLMEKFGTECPGLFEPYQLVFKAKKMQPITDRQKKYLKDLMVYHKIEINFNIDELSKNEASKKIDKILSEKGRIFD